MDVQHAESKPGDKMAIAIMSGQVVSRREKLTAIAVFT